MPGSRVIFIIALGVASVVVLALSGFVLTGGAGDKLDCVRDEATLNPRNAQGVVLPVERSFAAIEEAEAFICHRVVYPRDLRGWRLQGVRAARSQDLGKIIEGEGFASVSLAYTDDRPGTDLRFEISPFEIRPSSGVIERQIRVRGHSAVLQTGGSVPNFAQVKWRQNALDVMATATLGEGFSLDDFFAILESVR